MATSIQNNDEYDDRDAWGPYDTPETMHPERELEDEILDADYDAYQWAYGQ